MRVAQGPRPWTIHAFAVLFTAHGLVALIRALGSLELSELTLQAQYPAIDWHRDWVIVWHSAWFSIVLIPVVAVWLFASRLARILVTLMALATLPALYRFSVLLAGDYPAPWQAQAWLGLLQNAAAVMAVALLFLGASSRWLRQERAHFDKVFG